MLKHIDELAALITRFEAALQPLSDEDLDRRPESGGWTARECAGHLTITVERYNQALRALLETSPDKRGTGPRKPTLAARFILGMLRKEGAKKKRLKAPGSLGPEGSDRTFSIAGLIDVHRAHHVTAQAIAAAGLERLRIATPISRLLRVRACDAIELSVLHGHRHLDQALRAAGRSSG